LFDTYAPRWKERSSYPADVTWNGRTAEEEEIIRQERLAERREGYARKLETGLERYVKSETNREHAITETYVFTGPRARKKKGETASGYKRFIDKDRALPVVADVTITAHVIANLGEYESMYRIKCVYTKGNYLAKKEEVKDKVEEFARELNVAGAAVVKNDWDDKALAIRQARIAHIAAVRAGTEDAEMQANF